MERWVLAMQTGRPPKPACSYLSSWLAAADLLAQRRLVAVEHLELAGLRRGLDHRFRQLDRALPTVFEVRAHRCPRPHRAGDLPDGSMLRGKVARHGVDRHDRGDPVTAHHGDVREEVGRAELDLLGVLLEHGLRQRTPRNDAVPPRVQLHRPHRRHHHRGIGREARRPALDVEEALRAHVGPEPRFGDEELPGMNPDQVGHDRRVAVGDVAERAGVHEDGGVLERLQEVGLDGVTHDDRHGSRGLELLGGDRLAGCRVTHDDPPHTAPQVAQRGGESEHGHHLGRCGDVKTGLPWRAVLFRPEPAHNVAK
jgi:hypothetical protein